MNAAARIEAANKDYGSLLLVSEATADAAGDEFVFDAVDSLTLRGQSRPTAVFTLAMAAEE